MASSAWRSTEEEGGSAGGSAGGSGSDGMMETRATGSSSNRPTRGTASKYDFVKVFFFFYGLQPSKLLQVQASFRDVVQWIRKTQERQRPITRFSQVVCNFIRVWSYMCHEVLQKSRRMSHRCLKKNPFGWNCPKKNLCFCCPRITVLVEIHTSKNKKKKKRGKWGHVCMCALDCVYLHLLLPKTCLQTLDMKVSTYGYSNASGMFFLDFKA